MPVQPFHQLLPPSRMDRVMGILQLRRLRRMRLYQYAASVTLLFGTWQAAFGAVMIWLRMEETPEKTLWDSETFAIPLVNLTAGAVLSCLGVLLFCRLNWARIVTMYVLYWFAVMFLLAPVGSSSEQPGLARWVAIKLGASFLWYIPLVLAVLLMNERVRDEFVYGVDDEPA